MKRAHLRKVKSVSYPCQASIGNSVEQPDVAPLGVKRRARTSAAMIGLALSMGATGLLLPRQDDGAAAAEPKVPDTAIAATLPVAGAASQVDMQSSTTPVPMVQVVEHTVREGQTLQQLAEQYQVSAWSIAAENSLTLNATLKAGQVLRIPSPGSASAQVQTEVDVAVRPSPLVASANLDQLPSINGTSPDDALVTERNSALDRLQQQRDLLRESLAELRYEESDQVASLPAQAAADPEPLTTEAAPALEATPALEAPQSVEVQPIAPSPSPLVATVPDSQPAPSPSVVNALVDEPAAQPSTTQFETQTQTGFSESQVYRVNPGDTIAAIARAHNIPQSLLINANNLSNPNVIFVGQELALPSLQPSVPDEPVQIAFADTTASLPAVTPGLSVSTAAPQAIPPSVESSDLTAQPDVSAPEVSLPTEQLTTQQVAVAPFAETERTQEATPSLPEADVNPSNQVESVNGANPYVENLLSEIRALRQRQQPSVPVSTAASSELTTISAPTVPTSEVAISPHFANSSSVGGQDAAVLQNAASLAVQDQPSTQVNVSTDTSDSELVATAPLGSENYAPLLQPITGRMVSPDLPPLPGADSFLPEDGVFNGYIWPAAGLLTSGYGWRWGRMHQGIDIAADIGTPIYAAANGVVEYAGWNSGGYGNMVEIRHSDGSMTRYAHMNAIYVQTGQQLSQGDQLGEMGSTGYSTGPHLHFEVHVPDQGTVNPLAYLPQ